jgi:hypothetical protein
MIWIFGHSASLSHDLNDSNKGWPALFSKLISQPVTNLAKAGADNLFIFHTIVSNLSKIKNDDVVIVGWSHPSRKSFVYDDRYQDVVDNNTLFYDSSPPFFRSFNQQSHSWIFKKPTPTGKKFFDIWFKDYYSEYETELNFLAYRSSIKSLLKCKYIPFYFSKDSVGFEDDSVLYYLEFVLENNVQISKNNMHANEHGHELMAKHFYEHYISNR